VHRRLQAGIAGTEAGGAESIVLSGGYMDDIDEGEVIIYTGQGGQDPVTRQQIADEEFRRGIAPPRAAVALERSSRVGHTDRKEQAVFKRGSPEEESAKQQAKALEQEELRRQREIAAAAKAKNEERKLAEETEKAFRSSPAGQAQSAFDRSDSVFQFSMDVKDTKPIVIAMVGATTATTSSDPSAILNSIVRQGWELLNGSFVFHELGSESRDKFLASGQNVAVRGTIIGYYLFRRREENRADLASQAGTALATA
jgi:hypothetical protein